MTDPAFHIRRGVPADAEGLTVFATRTFDETYGSQNLPEDMEAHLASAFGPAKQAAELADDDVVTLLAEVLAEVAEAGGTLAGFAQVRRNPAPEGIEAQGPVELWRFYVDLPWQGQGLARQLMDEVRSAARGLGARSVWLSVWQPNTKAVRFYQKCGFRIAGKRTFKLGQDEQADHVMVMDL